MTLPASGELSLADIYIEINGSHSTQQTSLRTMSSDASKTVPDLVSDFYNYTHAPATVTASPSDILFDSMGNNLDLDPEVTSTDAWEASNNSGGWCDSDEDGDDGDPLNVTCTQNLSEEVRECTITLTIDGGADFYVEVCQDGTEEECG